MRRLHGSPSFPDKASPSWLNIAEQAQDQILSLGTPLPLLVILNGCALNLLTARLNSLKAGCRKRGRSGLPQPDRPYSLWRAMRTQGMMRMGRSGGQQRRMSPTASGFVSTLPMLLAIISSTVFGAVVDRTGRCKPLLVLGLVAMAAVTPVILTQDGCLLWVGVVAMGLLAMGVPTAFISAYPQVLGDPQLLPVGMGVFMFVQSLGQFFGSSVPAALLGPDLANWVLCTGVLAGFGALSVFAVLVCRLK